MSRHPLLLSLSREHHHGLVLARRAQRWATEGAPAVAAGWAAVRDAFRTELAPHFAQEESELLPRLDDDDGDGDGDGLRARTFDEHARLRELARRGETAAELASFGQLLHDHIRFEERTLFPALLPLLRAAKAG